MTDEHRVKLIAVNLDIINGYLVDMQKDSKQIVKMHCKKAIKSTENTVASFYKAFGCNDVEDFENGSDELKKVIEDYVFKT